jgi:hypothetical protein
MDTPKHRPTAAQIADQAGHVHPFRADSLEMDELLRQIAVARATRETLKLISRVQQFSWRLDGHLGVEADMRGESDADLDPIDYLDVLDWLACTGLTLRHGADRAEYRDRYERLAKEITRDGTKVTWNGIAVALDESNLELIEDNLGISTLAYHAELDWTLTSQVRMREKYERSRDADDAD